LPRLTLRQCVRCRARRVAGKFAPAFRDDGRSASDV